MYAVWHFYYGDAYAYAAEKDKQYVSVNAEFMESNLSGKFMNHSFRISIGDLINPNIAGHEDEVISDCMNIPISRKYAAQLLKPGVLVRPNLIDKASFLKRKYYL